MKFFTAVLLVALDQYSKLAIVRRLHQTESIPVIANIFHLTLVYNTGSAFGLLRRQNWVLPYVSIVAIVVMLWLFVRSPRFRIPLYREIWRLALILIVSGATGNLIDRMRLGYVIDFLDFRVWPVFNAADSFICCGAAILIWLMCKKDALNDELPQRT